MKVVAITGPEQVQLVDRPDPVARGEFAVVRVHVTPICTEYKAFRDGHGGDTLGHEAAGEVVEIGRPGPLHVGDRVVVMPQAACGVCPVCCAGDYIHCEQAPNMREATGNTSGSATYAQYLVKQDRLLIPIPDDLSYRHAGLACCGLGPTFGALRRMNVQTPDTVVITGMGPVGLGGVINATARGARVIAVESQPYRAALARALGAEAVVDPTDPTALLQIRALCGGAGPEAGVDCSGSPAAARLLIDAVRRRGQVAFIGEGGDLSMHVGRDLLRKGLTLHGCWHYNLTEAPRLLQHIRRQSAKLETFITHTFPMAEVERAWRLQWTGDCGKVLLTP